VATIPLRTGGVQVRLRRLFSAVGRRTKPLNVLRAIAAAALLGGLILAVTGSPSASASQLTTITLNMKHAYTPHAPPGATDDYHCTLINPHVTSNSFIVASEFFPGQGPSAQEVHHAILFLVPNYLAAQAEAANKDGNGWTCFGETPLPDTNIAEVSNTPWLSAWAPGHGKDNYPSGTGVPISAGSLVVMQVHYNLLVGDAPVKSKLSLTLEPGKTPLKPLTLDLMPAPPDIPCAPGVTGPLCSRAAEIQNLGQRFGQAEVGFVDLLERICGRDPQNPPIGDTTSCIWPITRAGNVVRLGAHMHLLGRTLRITLNPGTPTAKTLLYVPNFNFHYQRAYNLSKPVPVVPGDKVQVTCSYDPTLQQEVPLLRILPPHFVTWGDGSADEMCLGLMWEAPPTGGSNKVDWAKV
jgi:Copper type II ascorbate-dependent monooxygenase, N-terminal domain/Copper type II ascorbate-dependent monooxygenase, C-terminal domain